MVSFTIFSWVKGENCKMENVKQKKYSLISNIIYVYKGVAKYKPYLIGLIFLAIICTAGSKFIWLFLSKYIIEYITVGMDIIDLIKIVVILTGANILCMIGLNAVNFGKEPAAFFVRPMFMLKRNIRHIHMFYENLENQEVLDAVEKSKEATRNVDVGIEGIIRLVLDFCAPLFTCLVATVILCNISAAMAFFVILFGLLSYLSIGHATKKEKYFTVDNVTYQKRKLEYFKRLSNDYSYGKDIRVYQLDGKLLKTQEGLQQELHRGICKARMQWMISGLFVNTLDLVRDGLMYYGLVHFIMQGRIGIADFCVYVGCVHNLSEALNSLLKSYAKLKKCSSETNDYRSLNEFCDEEKKDSIDVENAQLEDLELRIDRGNKNNSNEKDINRENIYEIQFENVSFKYPGSNIYALKNINIKISKHEKLAIVGLNGAGKTTFVKLLLKLYKPTSGRILINGIDINSIETEEYYDLFAPVFQDMECYAFSLAENISMKQALETDKEYAKECLIKAGLGDKLNELELGMDTPMLKVCTEDGLELSGGEKQKLALARALYKNAPMLVLDEPTAALDAIAEGKMYEDFDSLIGEKLAVYISHRLASTRFCDNIALFENGEIVEYGTHSDLVKQDGSYAKMFKMQSQYYKASAKEGIRYEEASC